MFTSGTMFARTLTVRDGDSPEVRRLIEAARSLPVDHVDRVGIVRAIEILRGM